MSGYHVFTPMRVYLMRDVKSFIPKYLRTRKTAEDLVGYWMENTPGAVKRMESKLLADETVWMATGARMYFPESADMMEMLWRARMNVGLEDLDLPSFPKAFAVAWPQCEVEGVKLRGCLVWCGTVDERMRHMLGFFGKYAPNEKVFYTNTRPGSDLMMNVTYWGEKNEPGKGMLVYQCTVPGDLLKSCLNSDVDFAEKLGAYEAAEFIAALTPDESRQQYVLVKMLIHLMVYVRACPGTIRDGYPDGRKAREFTLNWMGFGAQVVGAPAAVAHGTHDSPMAHWRNWHFRTYPKQKDGEKRVGVVFIRGTMVNADIEPRTVEEDKAWRPSLISR